MRKLVSFFSGVTSPSFISRRSPAARRSVEKRRGKREEEKGGERGEGKRGMSLATTGQDQLGNFSDYPFVPRFDLREGGEKKKGRDVCQPEPNTPLALFM